MNIFSTDCLTANAAVYVRPVLIPLTGLNPLGMTDQVPDKPVTLA